MRWEDDGERLVDAQRLENENRMYVGRGADYRLARSFPLNDDAHWQLRADVLDHLRWLRNRDVAVISSILRWHGWIDVIPFITGERMLVEFMVRKLANAQEKLSGEETHQRPWRGRVSDRSRDDERRHPRPHHRDREAAAEALAEDE